MTTGPGSETIRLVRDDEHYIVNWHTDDFGLDPSLAYRIQIGVGTPARTRPSMTCTTRASACGRTAQGTLLCAPPRRRYAASRSELFRCL